MARSIIRFLTVLGITWCFAVNAGADALTPDRIGWSALTFRASKLLMAIDVDVAIATPDCTTVAPRLITAGEGTGIAPAGLQKIVTIETEAFGRLSQVELILNAGDGAALQRTSHDSGGRFRHRIYRFTDRGAYQRTRWPVGKDEERLPAERWPEWSEANEDLRPYPPAAVNALVTEPSALLYLIGAAPLDEPGDTFDILAYVRSHVHRVQVEVVGPETIDLKYGFSNGTTTELRDGRQPTIRMLIRGESIDGDSDDEFELLGLRGDIVLHLEPVTRAPLQFEGRVKIAGNVRMRLVDLTTTLD